MTTRCLALQSVLIESHSAAPQSTFEEALKHYILLQPRTVWHCKVLIQSHSAAPQSTFEEALKYNEGLRPHLSKIADDLNPLRAQVCACGCAHARVGVDGGGQPISVVPFFGMVFRAGF